MSGNEGSVDSTGSGGEKLAPRGGKQAEYPEPQCDGDIDPQSMPVVQRALQRTERGNRPDEPGREQEQQHRREKQVVVESGGKIEPGEGQQGAG